MDLTLPPGVEGNKHGVLNITMGALTWLNPPVDCEQAAVKLKFWGEKHVGVLIKPTNSPNAYLKSTLQYEINCTQPLFTHYLVDMGILQGEIVNEGTTLLYGTFAVPLKMYLRQEKQTLASAYGFSGLYVEGVFPVESEGVQIATIQLNMNSDFGANVAARPGSSPHQSPEKPVSHDDKRVPTNLQRNQPAAYDPTKIATNDPSKPNPTPSAVPQNGKGPRAPVNQPDKPIGTAGTKKTIPFDNKYTPTPSGPPPFVNPNTNLPFGNPGAVQPAVPQITESIDLNKWDDVREIGERLRNRMNRHIDYSIDDLPALPSYPKDLPPTDDFKVPYDFTNPHYIATAPSKPRKLQLSDMNYLRVTVFSANLEKPITSNIQLDCSIPILCGTKVNTDAVRIAPKVVAETVAKFNHESVHSLTAIKETGLSAISATQLRFKITQPSTDPIKKSPATELGLATVSWESVILANDYTYEGVINLIKTQIIEEQKTASRRQSRVPQKKTVPGRNVPSPVKQRTVVGTISVRVELLNELTKPEKPAPKRTEVKEEDKEPSPAKPAQPMTPKAYQLYLYLEHASQIEQRTNGTPRNLFISYKTFPCGEKITSPIYWESTEPQFIGHKMLIPISNTDSVRLPNAMMLLELWDKLDPATDELLGVVKLPLGGLAPALESGALDDSVYPMIVYDEFRPINDLKRGRDIGFVKVCLSCGTSIQIHRLEMTHKEYETPRARSPSPQRFEPGMPIPQKVEESPTLDDNRQLPPVTQDAVPQPLDPAQDPNNQGPTMRDSLDSIDDIAGLLNQKGGEYDPEGPKDSAKEIPGYPAQPPQHYPGYPSQPPQQYPGYPSQPPQRYPEHPQRQFDPMASAKRSMNISGTIQRLKQLLVERAINLEDEIRLYDPLNNGYIDASELVALLMELGLVMREAETLMLSLVQDNRVIISEALQLLAVTGETNTQHKFEVELTSLNDCGGLQGYENIVLQVKFPSDEAYSSSAEHKLSETQKSQTLIKFSRTYVGDELTDYFPATSTGMEVRVLRNGSVLATGVLPSEDFLEYINPLNTRVICLYCPKNSAIIGKVKAKIGYSQNQVIGNPRSSIIYGTECSDTVLNKQKIQIEIKQASGLISGMNYWRTQGHRLASDVVATARLGDRAVTTEPQTLNNEIVFGFSQAQEIACEELNRWRNEDVVFELICGDVVFGSCSVPMRYVMSDASVLGEFPLVNADGQIMGGLILGVMLVGYQASKETVLQPMDLNSARDTSGFTGKESEILQSPQSDISKEVANKPVVQGQTIQIVIESALRIKASREFPSPFVKYTWLDGNKYKSRPVLNTTCPAWNHSNLVRITDAQIHDLYSMNLAVEVWDYFSDGERQLIGVCEIPLSPLVKYLNEIDSWYHVMWENRQVGQLKVKISPSEILFGRPEILPEPRYSEKSEKPADRLTGRLTEIDSSLVRQSDEDLRKRFYDDFDSLTTMKLKLDAKHMI